MARLPKNINQFGSKDLPSSLQLLSRALAIAFFLLLGSSNLNAQVNLLYYISDGDNTLYTIDRNTGAVTEIGPTGVGAIEAIAYYPIQGSETLYAANNGDFGTLNLSTGAFTEIAEIDGGGTASGSAGEQTLNDVDGLTLDGQTLIMWAVERQSGSIPDLLFQIDLTTGQFIPDAFGAGVDYLEIVGPSIDVDVDDLAVDPITGDIYGVSNNSGSGDALIRVNKTTGEFTFVNSLAQDDIEGLAFHNDGLDNNFDLIAGSNATTNPSNNDQDALDFPKVTTAGVGNERDWRLSGDIDGDGVSNELDLDNDNDGILDADEQNCDNPTISFITTPIAFWTLDNTTDDSQGSNDERSSGNAPGYSTTAIEGIASADFNGTTHEIRYSQDGAFMELEYSTISFSAWIRPSELSGDRVIYEEGGRTNGFMLWLDDGVPTATSRSGGGASELNVASSITLTQTDSWYHVAAVFDNGNVYVYVDGIENSGNTSGVGNYTTIAPHNGDGGIGGPIGNAPNGVAGNYAGLMDAVRYDNAEAWSSADISTEAVKSCDTDGDGIENEFDLDSDNDGIPDVIEAGGTDPDGDGVIGTGVPTVNASGIPTAANVGAGFNDLDTDDDGFVDWQDLDADNDGIVDIIEAGGTDSDENGAVDTSTDTDGDGYADLYDTDNAGTVLPDEDLDSDGFPNRIDIDADGDGIIDLIESQVSTATPITPSGADTDGDGLDNSFDTDDAGTYITPVNTESSDQPDYLDMDSDNDTLSDALEAYDTDGDGTANTTPSGSDDDNDGLDNAFDNIVGPNATTNVTNNSQNAFDFPDVTTAAQTAELDWRELNDVDTDGDEIFNSVDIDDDNDGILDVDEGLGNPCLSGGVISSISTDLSIDVGNTSTLFDGITGAQNFYFTNNQAYSAATSEIFNITFNQVILLSEIRVFIEFDIDQNSFIGTGVLYRWEGSNDGLNWDIIPGTEVLQATDDLGVGNNVETFDLSQNTNQYSQYRLFWISGGQIQWDPYIDEITFTEGVCFSNAEDDDNDGIPNYLDLDSDNDGIADIIEAGGVDADGDGRVDDDTDTDLDGYANTFDSDNSGTALADGDFDSDGLPNRIDIDADGDGIIDLIESQTTTGSPVVPGGSDADADGIDNAFDPDSGNSLTVPVNTDAAFSPSDTDPDYLDTDSDNDGLSDAIEAYDTDGDFGINTSAAGADADGDGLDDNYDIVTGPNATTNPTNNSQDANDFPDITTLNLTTERDWRESNIVTCAPGEVNSNLLLWLKADEGASNWRDQSNNYNSLVTTGTVTNAQLINFNPSNTFDGTDYYISTLSINADSRPDLAVIAVYRPGSATAGSVWGEENGGFDRSILDGSGGDENEAVSNGTSNESGIAGLYADDETILSSVIFDEDVVNGSNVYIDGAVVATFTSDHGGEASSSLQIGAQGNGSNGFIGEIAEVIVYDQLLTSSSDREKIESYLAIKYGITLSENSDSDGNTYEAGEGDYLFSTGAAFWDADEVVGFQNNVAGIARDDASCLNQKQSRSENSGAIVSMGLDGDTDGLEASNDANTSSFAVDLSSLVWGHDGEELYDNSQNIDYDPGQVNSRLNREWRVQETGTVGTVTVSFDVSNLLGPTGVGTNDESQIVLMVDADGDFANDATVVFQSFVVAADGLVNFEVDFTDGLYFTLGSSEFGALPIELLDFEATPKSNHVLLEWSTLTETDNGFFRLERSKDGKYFTSFALINGAGTTTSIQEYQHLDLNPYNGVNYYRLVDISTSGEENYSDIILVHFEDSFEIDQPYPNPLKNGEYLNLKIPFGQQIENVNFVDVRGVGVRFDQFINDSLLRITSNSLKQGMYFLNVTISGQRHSFKVLVSN